MECQKTTEISTNALDFLLKILNEWYNALHITEDLELSRQEIGAITLLSTPAQYENILQYH